MTQDWTTLLHEAFECGDLKLFEECITQGADINSVFGGERVRLLKDAIGAGVEGVSYLLKYGADPSLPVDYTGELPLRYARLSPERLEVTRALIEGGACPLYEPEERDSPVHDAASDGDVDVLTLLLRSGGQTLLEVLDYCGRTPLMCAADEGSVEAAKILVEAGAKLDAVNDDYPPLTALSRATEKRKYDMVKYLLEAGADPHRPAEGESAVAIALRLKRSPEYLKLIQEVFEGIGSNSY